MFEMEPLTEIKVNKRERVMEGLTEGGRDGEREGGRDREREWARDGGRGRKEGLRVNLLFN